jgi:hypothetical protein
MVFDFNEALKKLEDVERQQVENSAAVRTILTNAKGRFRTIEVLGVKIKVRAVIPRNLRHYLATAYKDSENRDLDESEAIMYKVIAQMCVDPPEFKIPETWEALDNEEGVAQEVMDEIFKVDTSEVNKLKDFRQ